MERDLAPGSAEASGRTGSCYQQITIIDGSTFELYLNNMKPLLGLMVRNSELIIMNRCDDLTDDSLTRYRRGLKALNPQADLILEDAEGEIEQELLEEDLPYDMKADVIQIDPGAYGIWYIDALDKPEPVQGEGSGIYGHGLKVAGIPEELLCSGTYGHDLLRGGYDLPGLCMQGKRGQDTWRPDMWVKVAGQDRI